MANFAWSEARTFAKTLEKRLDMFRVDISKHRNPVDLKVRSCKLAITLVVKFA